MRLHEETSEKQIGVQPIFPGGGGYIRHVEKNVSFTESDHTSTTVAEAAVLKIMKVLCS